MSFFKRFDKKRLLKELFKHPILLISMLLMKGVEWFNARQISYKN